MTGRPKDPKTARNKNVLVIGGSVSGKTRFYVKPNLMQCFPTSDYPTSFVVTDPKGTLVLETHDGLLPPFFSHINEKFRTPARSNLLFMVLVGLLAAFVPARLCLLYTSRCV